MLPAVFEVLHQRDARQSARVEFAVVRSAVLTDEFRERQPHFSPLAGRQRTMLSQERNCRHTSTAGILHEDSRPILRLEHFLRKAPKGERVACELESPAIIAGSLERDSPVAARGRLPFHTDAIWRADKALFRDRDLARDELQFTGSDYHRLAVKIKPVRGAVLEKHVTIMYARRVGGRDLRKREHDEKS